MADNTFATPIIQRPLKLSFDIVAHSATKYLFKMVIRILLVAFVVVGDNKALADQLKYLENAMICSIAASFNSFLVLRGLKTLAIRMELHCENVFQFAEWLGKYPRVNRVYYPGLPHSPPICPGQKTNCIILVT